MNESVCVRERVHKYTVYDVRGVVRANEIHFCFEVP